ncbi:MAG: alpha/beta hydrolase [Desulfopila sp.]|nr:alpha/beta hydrolase [Desulfopila sp.]
MADLTLQPHYRLHYQLIEGDKDKPVLVYLHEALGCTFMWRDFPELLCRATGCPGLLYDRLGHGKSSPLLHERTIHYLHELALKELPLLLKQLIPDQTYILVGHSDGGSIALLLGAERPLLLRGIITEAAHVFVDAETLSGIQGALQAWQKGKLAGLRKHHGENTEVIFAAWHKTWLASWFRSWNIEYALPSITAPLLVLQGENDQYGSRDQVKSITSGASPDARAEIIAGCAHIPHLEAQSRVLDLMARFITERCTCI